MFFYVFFFFFSSRRRHTRSVSAFLLNRSSDLHEVITFLVCKLLMLICILTKNVITSCSVTMMLFLHLEVKPLMTLTTVLYLSCAQIGRASCRERVWISVVTVAVKKKIKSMVSIE